MTAKTKEQLLLGIYNVVLAGTRQLQFLVMMAASCLLLGIGVHVDPLKAQELKILDSIQPLSYWFFVFGAYGFARAYVLFGKPLHKYAGVALSVIGIWLWSIVFTSAYVNSAADGLFHVMPIFAEILIMVNLFLQYKKPMTRRKTDRKGPYHADK